MAKNNSDAAIIGGYRGLIDILVKSKGFRGYSTMDYVRERIRAFDPEYFKEEDELAAFQTARKEST